MQSLKTKFIINVVGAVLTIITSLVTIPLYIGRIGEDRYGILSLVWIMLGYLGFFDFGLSRATANTMAKLHDAPPAERGSVFMTSLLINLILGSLGGLIIYFAGGYILLATHGLSDHLRTEVKGIMPWIAPLLPLTLVSGVCWGAIESRERFLLANTLQLASSSLGQVFPLLVAIFVSPALTSVIPAVFCVRLSITALTLLIVMNLEKLRSLAMFDRRRAQKLMSYGVWVTVTNMVSPLMNSLDQFVIGNVIGAPFIARYSVPMSAAGRLQIFNGALTRTVFPRLSRFELREARRLAAKSTVMAAYLSAMLFAPALVVTHPFFEWWMGQDFAAYAIPVATILFFSGWINGVAWVPGTLLQAQGRPDAVAKLHMSEVLPYLALLWFLVHKIGLNGAALAWAARATVDTIAMNIWARMPLRPLLPALPAFIGLSIGLMFDIMAPGWPLLAQLAVAAALGLGIGCSGLIFVPHFRTMLGEMRTKVFRRAAAP